MKSETKAIHGVRNNDKGESWGSTINMASAFPIKEYGAEQEFEYGRVSSPACKDFETLIAKLENGKYGFGFSSGMATTPSVFTMFKAGDYFILGFDVYGGTYRIMHDIFNKSGFKSTSIDTTNLSQIEAAVRPNTKAIFAEPPSNPLLDVTNIRGVVAIAKAHNLLTIVDNIFLSPVLQRPLELGADIVLHSATELLGGHNDLIIGAAVANSDELAEKIFFAQVTLGVLVSPLNSWLLLRSMKTLRLKVGKTQENVIKLLAFLKTHSEVEKVYYPTEAHNKDKAIQEAQASGDDSVFSFTVKSETKAKSFLESLKVALFAVSPGGVETLVTHPSSLTHTEFPEEGRVARGVTRTLIRVAVGIEDADDLIADFKQALKQ